jgi:hypothetical protein
MSDTIDKVYVVVDNYNEGWTLPEQAFLTAEAARDNAGDGPEWQDNPRPGNGLICSRRLNRLTTQEVVELHIVRS